MNLINMSSPPRYRVISSDSPPAPQNFFLAVIERWCGGRSNCRDVFLYVLAVGGRCWLADAIFAAGSQAVRAKSPFAARFDTSSHRCCRKSMTMLRLPRRLRRARTSPNAKRPRGEPRSVKR